MATSREYPGLETMCRYIDKSLGGDEDPIEFMLKKTNQHSQLTQKEKVDREKLGMQYFMNHILGDAETLAEVQLFAQRFLDDDMVKLMKELELEKHDQHRPPPPTPVVKSLDPDDRIVSVPAPLPAPAPLQCDVASRALRRKFNDGEVIHLQPRVAPKTIRRKFNDGEVIHLQSTVAAKPLRRKFNDGDVIHLQTPRRTGSLRRQFVDGQVIQVQSGVAAKPLRRPRNKFKDGEVIQLKPVASRYSFIDGQHVRLSKEESPVRRYRSVAGAYKGNKKKTKKKSKEDDSDEKTKRIRDKLKAEVSNLHAQMHRDAYGKNASTTLMPVKHLTRLPKKLDSLLEAERALGISHSSA